MVKPKIGLTDVLVVDLVSTSACVVLSWSSIRQTMAALHSPNAEGKLPIREMFTFAWHMALVGPMSGAASPGAIRLALANGLGVAQSGLFAFLQSLERLVSRYLPATLVRNLIRPILISRAIGQGRTELLKSGTGLLLKSNMLTVVAGLVVIAVCGDQIVFIMSGHKFRGAGLTLLLLYVNMIAASQRGVQEMVMQITGHTRQLWITTVVSPVALFMVWLFSKHGLNIAVLIVTAGSMTANWLASWVLQVRTDWFRVDWRGMAAIFLPGLAAGAVGMALAMWMKPLIAGALAPLIFVLFLRIGKPFNAGEVRTVERAIGKRAAAVLRGFAV
jgi:O-antigen/teichoic acid export membrane protein